MTPDPPALQPPASPAKAEALGYLGGRLAVFFAWHVLWPQGLAGPFDGRALLLRGKVGVIPVVLCSGLAGLLLTPAR